MMSHLTVTRLVIGKVYMVVGARIIAKLAAHFVAQNVIAKAAPINIAPMTLMKIRTMAHLTAIWVIGKIDDDCKFGCTLWNIEGDRKGAH